MPLVDIKEKWSGSVTELTLGATKEEGGTRTTKITVGGSNTLPNLTYEGQNPHRTAVAMEVFSKTPEDWPDMVSSCFTGVLNNPAAWAKKNVEEYGADLICLKLDGAHPDRGNASPKECADVVKSVLAAVGVPLIIWGCGVEEKDNEVLPVVSQATAGENCLLGTITEKNYKTLVASAQADGHKVIAESPLDINIAKQVNILASDMGFPLERLVIFPTTGALGYGMEYAYSIMERGRIAALNADKILGLPVICDVGYEAWRAKEAKASEKDFPAWGEQAKRGVLWESITATVLLQAGAEILIMRHPKAVAAIKKTIAKLQA